MYLWFSLNYHAILLTFYELRLPQKIKGVHKSQQLRNDEKTHKLSNSQQITILTFFYYMPLNYSEKDTEDSASIVQTLGAPLYEMKRKSHVLHM